MFLAVSGHTNSEIAQVLHLSKQTVHNLRARLMEKLGLHDRLELLRYAIRHGLVRARGRGGRVCNDCHGKPHEVRRLEQWDDEQRAGACAECHEGATPKFLQTLIHDHPSAGFLPSAYFAGRFLMLLTAAVLALAIIHVELDLLRWIVRRRRDNATRGTDHGERLETPSSPDCVRP